MRSAKFLLAALTAALALAAAVGTASARRLEFSEQKFTFITTNVGYDEGSPTTCRVTLSGSFHSRTISKVCGQLIGYLTSANIPSCSEGQARVLAETLPWHVRYASFSGTLPNITQVKLQIVGYAYQEVCISVLCLYKSTAESPLVFNLEVGAGGRVALFRWEEGNRIPRFSGEGLVCPAELRLSGTGEVTAFGTTNAITIRLVQ